GRTVGAAVALLPPELWREASALSCDSPGTHTRPRGAASVKERFPAPAAQGRGELLRPELEAGQRLPLLSVRFRLADGHRGRVPGHGRVRFSLGLRPGGSERSPRAGFAA